MSNRKLIYGDFSLFNLEIDMCFFPPHFFLLFLCQKHPLMCAGLAAILSLAMWLLLANRFQSTVLHIRVQVLFYYLYIF